MAKRKIPKSKSELRDVDELVDFPSQPQFYPELSEEEDRSLDEDIWRNGQRDPIQVLPKNKAGYLANTILDGHRRRDSLRRQNIKEAKVLVRYDLAKASQTTIELEFLNANFNRRHLPMLAKARIALRLFEIERNRALDDLSPWESSEARDRVGEVIGMSGRNLNRYFRILRLPLTIQTAFEQKELTLRMADKVAGFREHIQEKIAKKIDAGKDPAEVVQRYLGKLKEASPKLGTLLGRFVRDLEKHHEVLADRVDDFRSPHHVRDLPVLRRGKKLVADIIARIEKLNSESKHQDILKEYCDQGETDD